MTGEQMHELAQRVGVSTAEIVAAWPDTARRITEAAAWDFGALSGNGPKFAKVAAWDPGEPGQ